MNNQTMKTNRKSSLIKLTICFMAFIFLLCSVQNVSAFPIFVRIAGDFDDEVVKDMVKTSDGGFVVTGYTYSGGLGGKDVLLVKFDANANVSWAYAFGGTDDEEGYSVIEDASNRIVVTGYTNSFGPAGSYLGYENIILSQWQLDGTHIQTKYHALFNALMMSRDDVGEQIIDNGDGYIVAGWTMTNTAAVMRLDVYIAKFSYALNLLSHKSVYATLLDHWGYSVAKDFTDNGFFVVGGRLDNSTGRRDLLIVKFDAALNKLWTWRIGDVPNHEVGFEIINTSDGGFLIGGAIQPDALQDTGGSPFLLKRDPGMNAVWQRIIYQDASERYAFGDIIESFTEPGFVLAGTAIPSDQNEDAFIAKWDLAGNYCDARRWDIPRGPVPSSDWGRTLFETSVIGGFMVTGRTDAVAQQGWDIPLFCAGQSGHTCIIPGNINPSQLYTPPEDGLITLQVEQFHENSLCGVEIVPLDMAEIEICGLHAEDLWVCGWCNPGNCLWKKSAFDDFQSGESFDAGFDRK